MLGRGPPDHQYRQESCGDVRGAQRAGDTREGGRANQGQGGEGDGAGRLAVCGGSERGLRLLSVPSSKPIWISLWNISNISKSLQSVTIEW